MPKALIADDSRVQIHVLSTWLKEKGFTIVSAVDALQAWMLALRELPDLIVLDINMPAGSGVNVLRRLSSSAKTRLIPVIVISGTENADILATIDQLGAAAFLRKPLQEEDFLLLVDRVVTPQRTP